MFGESFFGVQMQGRSWWGQRLVQAITSGGIRPIRQWVRPRIAIEALRAAIGSTLSGGPD
jgi:hypothetical protein